jgi:hypothetical protein
LSRVGTAAKFAATVGGRRLRARSGPVLYLSLAMTGIRLVRRFAGRRSESLLLTELKPGEGLSIRALRRGE